MLSEAQIKSVALFFFYACMDEETAFQSTTKTIEKCKKRTAKGALEHEDVEAVLVNSTFETWKQWQQGTSLSHISVSHEAGWMLAEGAEFGVWQDFRRSAEADEFLAVIWSKLLKIPDEHIAKGLDVSVGTVRHRVGRGLRQLGHIKKQ